MKWYITSQNEVKTSTNHGWISDEDNKALERCMITGERLVTERTCTLKSLSHDTSQCSSCGCTFCHFVPDEFIQSGIHFCPNCGARIV